MEIFADWICTETIIQMNKILGLHYLLNYIFQYLSFFFSLSVPVLPFFFPALGIKIKKTEMSRKEEREQAAVYKTTFWKNGRITVKTFLSLSPSLSVYISLCLSPSLFVSLSLSHYLILSVSVSPYLSHPTPSLSFISSTY